MAGLLDFLDTDQGRMGLGLLAASAPSMEPTNFGARLAQGMQNYQGMQQQQQKGKLLDMQMQNYQSEIDARKLAEQKFAQQQAIDAQWLGLGTQQPTAGASGTAPAVSGAPGAAVASPVDGKIGELSRQYGVPKEALWADYRFNGGKKIAELINDSSKPNWMNVNGNLVNTNDKGFQGGIQGGISAGKDGQVTAWQPDGRGGLVVGAPNGALDTFKAYKDVESGLKPIKVYNPVTGREEFTSERAVVTPASASNFPSGYAGGSRQAADAGRLQIFQDELKNPNLSQGDRAALQREIARIQPVAPAAGTFAAGPSLTESAAAKANETRMVDSAKADVVRDSSKQQAGKLYGQLTAGVDRAIELLNQKPTASGVGAMADSTAAFFGKSTKGADVASQLDTLSGWLTANVPRMEGPQSDKDVLQYRIMSAAVGDRAKPLSQRLAAAQELKTLQNKYAELNGGYAGSIGASGDWTSKSADTNKAAPTASKIVDALPTANNSNKGQRIRDTATGKILISNGIQWKPE